MLRHLLILPDGTEVFSGASGAAVSSVKLTRAVNDAVERTLGDMNGHSRLLHNEHIYASEQCAAAREHDTVVDYIGGKLGRSFFERGFYGFHNGIERLRESLAHLCRADGYILRQTVHKIPALYHH